MCVSHSHFFIQRYGGSTYDGDTMYVDNKLVEVVGVDKITKQQRLVSMCR